MLNVEYEKSQWLLLSGIDGPVMIRLDDIIFIESVVTNHDRATSTKVHLKVGNGFLYVKNTVKEIFELVKKVNA